MAASEFITSVYSDTAMNLRLEASLGIKTVEYTVDLRTLLVFQDDVHAARCRQGASLGAPLFARHVTAWQFGGKRY